MAEILPFNAFRYSREAGRPKDLLFPLSENTSFTELSPHAYSLRQIAALPMSEIRDTLQLWISLGIISKEPVPGVYVYYQYFRQDNNSTLFCRKGFISLLRVRDWEEKVIFKHEEIFPEIMEFHLDLLKHAEMQLAPIHGLYTDGDNVLEKYMDESMLNPVLEMSDDFGVLHKLSRIHDKKCIEEFMKILQEKSVVIADGHHRYSAALKYSKTYNFQNKFYTPAYLTNSVHNITPILPFHRLLQIPHFNEKSFFQSLHDRFTFYKVDHLPELTVKLSQKKFVWGMITSESLYIIELKREIESNQYPILENLRIVDEWILHTIPGLIKTKESVRYFHSTEACLNEIKSGNANLAIVMKEPTVEDVMFLSENGLVLPEKSTYFYPRMLGGIVMCSTDFSDSENQSPCYKNI